MAVAHRDVNGLLRKHGYTEIKTVGQGSFGKAILVKSDVGDQLICKMVDISKASRKEMDEAVKEGKLLAELNHPYIVRYRENFTESGWLCTHTHGFLRWRRSNKANSGCEEEATTDT